MPNTILEFIPPKENETIKEIVAQNRIILEMNQKLLEAFATAPFMIAKEENGHKI